MAEDKVFVLQALNKVRNITVLENKLYYYFKSANSATQIVGLDMLPAGKELLKIAQETNNTYVLHDAYTAFLAHRYLNMFKEDYVSIRKDTNECLKACKILAKTLMPLKERLLLNLFVDTPFLYRWWRLAGDHTLAEWERAQRKQKR